jgi:hypothetical protein
MANDYPYAYQPPDNLYLPLIYSDTVLSSDQKNNKCSKVILLVVLIVAIISIIDIVVIFVANKL